jgi:hypothetical protein
MTLRDRLPSFDQIIPLYAVVSLFIYGWTTFRFLQKLPSWLYYLNLREIISIFSTLLTFNFAESILLTFFIIGFCAITPRKWFKDLFVARGALLAILGTGYMMYLAVAIGQSKASQFPWEIINLAPVVALVILSLSIISPKIVIIQKAVEAFASRTIIFLYILIPISALGILVFTINNIF